MLPKRFAQLSYFAVLLSLTGCGPKEYSGPVSDRPPVGQARPESAGNVGPIVTASAPRPERDESNAPTDAPSADITTPSATAATAAAASQPASNLAVQPVYPDPPPAAGSIRSDILLVNDATLSVAEVLYALRESIEDAKKKQTRSGLANQLERWLRSQTQQEVGSLLVYQKVATTFDEQRNKVLDKAIDAEIQRRIAREFDDSSLRFEKHLKRYGLTLADAKARLRRQLVVRSYTQDLFLPQINIRRDELFDFYRANRANYVTPETRELWMIEIPFARFLPNGGSWAAASQEDKSVAWLASEKQARAAHAALATRPFDEVAREYSLGVHREAGGLWGVIGAPLQSPYDGPSGKAFALAEGQFTEPMQTDVSWCIARCGKINQGKVTSFEEAQDKIRETLREQRYNKLATDYVLRLADQATLVGFDSFVRIAMQRALNTDWPAAEQ